MLSSQLTSYELPFSGNGAIVDGLRLRLIIKAAFNTIRVNQVLSADRPSKLRKWRYPERNASWTASSASCLFCRMEYAMATNFGRDTTSMSSNAFLRRTSVRVLQSDGQSRLPSHTKLTAHSFFGVVKAGKALLKGRVRRHSRFRISSSLLIPVSLTLHTAIVCPRCIFAVQSAMRFVFKETEVRWFLHGGRSATDLRQRLSTRKREKRAGRP